MANRRMVPTRFFKDPDIMSLSSRDHQLILLGLILAADDEGREVAHAGLLGREMDYPSEQVETALQELETNDLLVLYQVGKHRYYQLTRWNQWQTLGGRTTPSRYPAPPTLLQSFAEPAGKEQGNPGETLGKRRGNSHHFPDQVNLTESNVTEEDGQHTTVSSDGKVVPFPQARTNDTTSAAQGDKTTETEMRVLTQQVARILRLPMSESLSRLVAEYAPLAGLSLTGEADAAREWIDDPARNRKKKRMSPAQFRSWLKIEVEAMEKRRYEREHAAPTPQATGTTGGPPAPTDVSPVTGRRNPSLMHLADADQHQTKGVQP